MPLKLLIFDFDGTLADTLPICIGAFQSSIAKVTGRQLSKAEITAHFGIAEDGIMRRLVPDAWEECLKVYMRDYEAAHKGIAPFPGIVPLLEELRRSGIILAVATGKGAESTKISFSRLNLAQYFSEIRTGSPNGDIKAEHIRDLLKLHSVPGQSAAYVGDSPTDVVAAREAGVIQIAAAWASTTDENVLAREKPEVIFTTVKGFVQWIAARK